ncbi:uncharacterized protein LOC116344982 [Contarinia nasturtii]|uniref:uncharacterized protein LOC116344982 n=1 Tax=Contarinia nasturtii TaxID=265458 RepID=UPI0012D3D5A3|nr:uncharacterized protein LOC116344982 [Contarinia nasturtii]
MKFIFVLTVSFLLFEGFVIKCHKVDPAQPELSNDLMEEILSVAGLDATIMARRANISAADNVMSRIFENHIIVINLHGTISGIEQHLQNGELHLHIGNFNRLMSLFEKFGKNVRRIHINYKSLIGPYDRERQIINKNIIKRFGDQLTELKITTFYDAIWNEISNENGEIHFPNVKKFSYTGINGRDIFDLHSIFPKLETFRMNGLVRIIDKNCLANVKNLKELELKISSIGIEEHQLDSIFANNKGISTLVLSIVRRKDTLRSIEENLKHLETLEIQGHADNEILERGFDRVYNLKSVITFRLNFYVTSQLVDKILSFEMPNLKRLYLQALLIDNRITDFINHFKNLEMADVRSETKNVMVKQIGKLIYAKAFVTIDSDVLEISLLEIFETFDRKHSSVKTWKVFGVEEAKYIICSDQMNAINGQLKDSNKPTWTLSYDRNEKYLVFKRDL